MKKFNLKIFLMVVLTSVSIFSCKERVTDWESDFKTPKSINCITIDKNIFYIGTWGRGLYKFDSQTETFEQMETPSYNDNWIYDIVIDSSGNKWISTEGGIYLLKDKNWTRINNFPADYARKMIVDKNGSIWFSGYKIKYNFLGGRIDEGKGLIKFDGQNFNTIYPLSFTNFTALTVDMFNNLWCGALSSNFNNAFVLRFNGNNWTKFDSSNSNIPQLQGIYSMNSDYLNRIWIGGSEKDGILNYSRGNWNIYNKNNSNLPYNRADDIESDANGNVWFALYDVNFHDGALAKFDGINWTIYTKDNSGLPSNYVRALAVDKNNVLWIGTDRGLVKFDGTYWKTYR
ncbi:MAG: hypothetical protein N3F03_01270 [Ignavibacteria bacterium]|nr:hypothetical protein [Ignavibacteria bacterium]